MNKFYLSILIFSTSTLFCGELWQEPEEPFFAGYTGEPADLGEKMVIPEPSATSTEAKCFMTYCNGNKCRASFKTVEELVRHTSWCHGIGVASGSYARKAIR